jgi:hypothetical protein
MSARESSCSPKFDSRLNLLAKNPSRLSRIIATRMNNPACITFPRAESRIEISPNPREEKVI